MILFVIYLKKFFLVQFTYIHCFHMNAHFKSFQLMYHIIESADVCLFCDVIGGFSKVLPQPLC